MLQYDHGRVGNCAESSLRGVPMADWIGDIVSRVGKIGRGVWVPDS